jgi:hypothetical protein
MSVMGKLLCVPEGLFMSFHDPTTVGFGAGKQRNLRSWLCGSQSASASEGPAGTGQGAGAQLPASTARAASVRAASAPAGSSLGKRPGRSAFLAQRADRKTQQQWFDHET